jgi:Allene oxide cyclase barrel like domain
MTRLLALVTLSLAMAFAPAFGDEKSKRIHVTAVVVEQTFTGDIAKPAIGDRLISSAELFDKHDEQVGTGAGVCTVVSAPETPSAKDTVIQCFISAVFDEGEITFGAAVQLPEVGAVGQFSILGGTGKFRKARGEVTLTVLSPNTQDAVFELE